MNNRDIFKRQIQSLSKRIATEYNFALYRRTFLVREENNIVSMIVFDFPQSAMQFHVATQPLYVPSDILHITFGYRFRRRNLNTMGYWGEHSDQFDSDIAEIESLILDEAFPFLQQTSSPYKIIELLNNGLPNEIKLPPHFKNTYLAYSLLMIKEYNSAILPFTSVLTDLRQYVELVKKEVTTVNLMLSM
ncbi:MAG: hypothetical protein RR450_01370, partial [Oscillospiraceae bacterium]